MGRVSDPDSVASVRGVSLLTTRSPPPLQVYLIDKLALRVGNEKNTDEEADTVGCCSLRVEHVKLDAGENQLHLNFLGKVTPPQRSPPTAHRPPLTAHRSPLTAHRSPLTTPLRSPIIRTRSCTTTRRR